MTRIVAGIARGRRLRVPPGTRVRPTTDRVKEAMFSSLQPLLGGARVLDLYAGSGGLGLEAASRGAAVVVLVERDRQALQVLRANLTTVGLDGVTVINGDVKRVVADAVEQLARPTEDREPPFDRRFDVALLDPPYDLDNDHLHEVLASVAQLMAPEGVVVVERSRRSGPVKWPAPLVADQQRRYGDTTVSRASRPR